MSKPTPEALDFRWIAENTYDWESWITLDGRPAWVSPAVERITGHSAADCLAMPDYPLPIIAQMHRPEVEETLRQGLAGWSGNDLPLHLLSKNGKGVPAALSWLPIRDADGAVAGLRLSVRDLTGSVRAADAWRYGRALAELVRSVTKGETLTQRLRAITEAASASLGVARVGVWMYAAEGAALVCANLFDRANAVHAAGATLAREDYPAYFDALDNERAIDAREAVTDPRTAELAHTYLLPHRIGAMLDSPIVRSGDTVGVLCHEHIGTPRHWSPEEIGFAASLADLVAMALETEENRQLEAQRALAQTELQHLNAELEARVADRTARLQEANQQLESFAYSVAHDLKAPLRGIDGYSKLLLEDYRKDLPDEAQRFLDNIRAAAGRMNQLIEDLLAYSRLERRRLSSQRVSLAELVADALAELTAERAVAVAAPRIVTELNGLWVRADAEALRQVIRNLLDNAIKFSRDAERPAITIFAEATQDDRVLLSVADNGCGFDEKYHDRIFEIFQRLHRSEDYPGTGVGLAIVRKATERMGGRVWARSRPGAGATFFLELPP
jgi:PAS domain S-box-containing protein